MQEDEAASSAGAAEAEEEEEEEEVTAGAVLAALRCAWLNERLAPELLPHRQELVDSMLGQLQHMERHVARLPPGDLRRHLHAMELARIRYLLGGYLRARLRKLEAHCVPLLRAAAAPGVAAPAPAAAPHELRYARRHLQLQQEHCEALALARMPGNMREFDAAKLAVHPDLNAHIFLKANETINGVVVEGVTPDQDEEIDLEEGSQHILQYKPIADLVKTGKVQLI